MVSCWIISARLATVLVTWLVLAEQCSLLLQEGAAYARGAQGAQELPVVFLHRIYNRQGHGQRIPALCAGYRWCLAAAHAMREFKQLQLKCISQHHLKISDGRAWAFFSAVERQLHGAAFFSVKINSQAFTWLEKAHTPFHALRNTAGSDIGGTAVGKDDVRIGNVGVGSEHRRACRTEAGDG